MKKVSYLFMFFILAASSCQSDDEISPEKIWYDSCSTFQKEKGGYTFNGCCYRIILKSVVLKKKRSFSADGTLYEDDGTGKFKETAVKADGSLSATGKELKLNFSYSSQTYSYELTQDSADLVCDCACF